MEPNSGCERDLQDALSFQKKQLEVTRDQQKQLEEILERFQVRLAQVEAVGQKEEERKRELSAFIDARKSEPKKIEPAFSAVVISAVVVFVGLLLFPNFRFYV